MYAADTRGDRVNALRPRMVKPLSSLAFFRRTPSVVACGIFLVDSGNRLPLCSAPMRARQGYPSRTTLARLDAERKRFGVTLDMVAAPAAVTIQTVSRVLHGHTKSANVVATVRRLIAEAKSAASVAVA